MQRRTVLTTLGAALALPALARAADETIRLRDFYARDGGLSDLARAREGTTVRVAGFMAPPLKADSKFFVLTKQPMSVCPFCETEAEWPDNILAVYTRRTFRVVAFNRPIEATGVLSLGAYRDPDTGFLSLLRLENARFKPA